MGISLSSIDFVAAAFLGFGLHLVTGTILGAIIGGIAVKVESHRNISNAFRPTRSLLMGIGTGILVWMILFLPITALLIQPSIGRIAEILSLRENSTLLTDSDSNSIIQYFSAIAISAIAFHIVWGAIFGFIISSLIRMKISSMLSTSFSDLTTLTTTITPFSSSSSYSSSPMQLRKFSSSSLKIATFGLLAGLICSLGISGLILLAEKISSLPVGTFYYVLVSALTSSFQYQYSRRYCSRICNALNSRQFYRISDVPTFCST